MWKILQPPAYKPEMEADKVDAKYKRMRLQVFLGIFIGYAGFYIVRKNFSMAIPELALLGFDQSELSIVLAMNAVPIMMAMPAGMSMRLVFRMSFKVMDHMVNSVSFFECFYSAFSGNVSRKPHSLWRLRVPSSAVHSSGLLSACSRPPRSGRRRTRAHGRRKTRRPHHA